MSVLQYRIILASCVVIVAGNLVQLALVLARSR